MSKYEWNDYLITCNQRKIAPEIPFKGSLNVRIGKELHRKLAIAATHNDISINAYIKNLLEKGLNDQHHPNNDV